jgi:hypothetical protein
LHEQFDQIAASIATFSIDLAPYALTDGGSMPSPRYEAGAFRGM